MENIKVLVKSEKTSQKKKKKIVWAISVLLVIATLVTLVIDYSDYKKGQEYGLTIAVITPGFWIDEDDSYAEQCKNVYSKLNEHTYDMFINGIRYDASDVRRTENAVRSAFADVMKSAGYYRYSSYNVADWFKYTNIVEYFLGYYWTHTLSILCYIVLLFSIVFTIWVNREEKKEIVVYDDSVLCRINPKKSKQLVFEDINTVDFGKSTLRLVGTGIKFKISNLSNVESIKSVIIERKNSAQTKFDSSNAGSADELKKYKDLFDNGVITQEEFEAKKKQLLGL